jgi:IS30 family transposase
MRYVQLTMTERQEIAKARTRPVSLRDVAEALGRATSTISREVRRNGTGHSTKRLSPKTEPEPVGELSLIGSIILCFAVRSGNA